MAASSVVKAGDVIADRYVLNRKLGHGAAGVVWLAADPPANQWIALKLPHLDRLTDDTRVVRFEREAEILTELRHPCIARAIDFSAAGPQPYLAMELVRGHTLRRVSVKHAEANVFIDITEVMTWTEQLAVALDYAHGIGIVHRDLKPDNIMVGEDFLKILDFGVARLMFIDSEEQTTVGRRFGTLLYMSPEQLRGEPAKPASDIFALGTTIFSLLTNRRAWARDDQGDPQPVTGSLKGENNGFLQISERIFGGAQPLVSQWRDGLTDAVDEVLAQAMSAREEERYQTAVAFANDLDRALSSPPRTKTFTLALSWLQEGPLDPTRPTSLPDTALLTGAVAHSAPPSRSRLMIWGVLLLLLALAVLTAAWISTPPRPEPARVAVAPERKPQAAEAPNIEPRMVAPPPEAATPEAPPPRKRMPRSVRKAVKRSPPEPPKPRTARRHPLLRMIEQARGQPDEAARTARIEKALLAESKRLPAGSSRTSVERCAATAGIAGSLDELARCVRMLIAASSGEGP